MQDLQHSSTTALPMLLYYSIQMCFLYYWTGLPTRQLLAIPKVAWETLQWKILWNFRVPKDCEDVMQHGGCFLNQRLKQHPEATHKQGDHNISVREIYGKPNATIHPSVLYLYPYLRHSMPLPQRQRLA